MAERIEITQELQTRLYDSAHLPAKVVVNNKTYFPETSIKTSVKGSLWRVKDEFGRRRALKLCQLDDYSDRSYLQELSRASVLERFPVFARFIDAGVCEIQFIDGCLHKFIGFVEEWVDGETLGSFLSSHANSITTSFFLAYVQTLCGALNALLTSKMEHNDLHEQNVMVAPPPKGDLSLEWSIRIIDTGSLKPIESGNRGEKDDHRHFIEHIVMIWNVLKSRKMLSARDRRFLSQSFALINSMLDDDSTMGLRDPVEVKGQFELAYNRANMSGPPHYQKLTSPFEFISAEHIADDRLLVEIFAKSCPWLQKVAGPDPCLVTGPRGCGKSTIFRWLSLKAHLQKGFQEIEGMPIVGFYISCSSDIQNRLGWICTEALAVRFSREIVHYFNLLVAREVLHTLALVRSRTDSEANFGLGENQGKHICEFLTKALHKQTTVQVKGARSLDHGVEILEQEMFASHDMMLRGSGQTQTTPETFLGDLTTFLMREVAFLSKRKIVFLVDDFSSHRLPEPVQVVLNRIIWERRGSHVFKLSSEKHGAVLVDALGATTDVTREMLEVDCGREYIALDDSDQVERTFAFAVELLNNRLRAAGYNGSAETLIGNSPKGSLAKKLADKQQGRQEDYYYGLEYLSSVCSGDIATLLFLYRRIFERAGIDKDSTGAISYNTQHEAVVSCSRELFESIRHYFPSGQEMYAIVNEFGNLVRNILQYGRWHKKGTDVVPPQCPRIELDQDSGTPMDNLISVQQELAIELLRRSIFIEMEPGLSRHGNVTTLRWQLRRVYLPHFRAALAKNDAVKEKMDWFKYFLTDPKGACEQVWLKWPKRETYQTDEGLFNEQSE